MNFELFEFDRRVEIGDRSITRLSKAHLLPPIGTHSIYLPLVSENKRVQLASTNLFDSILELLNTSRSVHCQLGPIHAVTKTELALGIVTKCVDIAILTEHSCVLAATVELCSRASNRIVGQ